MESTMSGLSSSRKPFRTFSLSQGSQANDCSTRNLETEIFTSSSSRARYEAYSKLQASAVAFGEQLPIPEIVAVGGQSDGKSSLLEALLGFRFNVKEVEMGTRRPLMLQMIHDPAALEPRCRLQDEDADDYGPPIEPASAVAEAIRSRTELFLKRKGTTVSAKPIVMRAEYAFCSNLTIIDTPGFILKAKKGEVESTPDDILNMVRALAAPQHRILLFLQQSSVEWCSSLWLDSIRAVDPTLRRTVVVVSKFDNRLTEFSEKWEVDRYLSAGGYLGESARPFFVALPKDKVTTSNDEFRRQIAKVDSDVLRHLRENVTGGFDEEQFGGHIGFGNLRGFLESELQRRYRETAPATLALLEQRCEEVAAELSAVDARLAVAADVASLRRAAMLHAADVSGHVVALLDGAREPDPAEWGRTTEEERAESRVAQWPGVVTSLRVPNSGLRMYGGAAFERVVNEFRCAACSLDCPPISREEASHRVELLWYLERMFFGRAVLMKSTSQLLWDNLHGPQNATLLNQVANILLAQAGRTGAAAAAASIARSAAQAWLGPLLVTACNRLAHVLSNLFDLALERIRIHESSDDSLASSRVSSRLSGYVTFHAALRRAHQQFIRDLAKNCKLLVHHHLLSVTNPFTQMLSGWEGGPFSLQCGLVNGFGHTFSAPFCVEASDGTEAGSEANEHSDEENMAPMGNSQMDNLKLELVSPTKGRVPLKELPSQFTVPDTPSPDQTQKLEGKRYCARASSHIEVGERKRKGANRTVTKPDGRQLNNCKSGYAEVCSLAAEHFGKIREMLVQRTVPLTLYSGFLSPCRDHLAVEIGVELFAVSDERFMEMFVAPGAAEKLQEEREALDRRCHILSTSLEEFRSLARSL